MFTVTRRLDGSKGKVTATTRSTVAAGFETNTKTTLRPLRLCGELLINS
jgi:hypothetical protein